MLRHPDNTFGADVFVFGQPAIGIDNPLLGHRFERSAEPIREEGIDDPVADSEACHARADRSHLASAIRERTPAGRDRHRISAIDNHQVAEVERTRAHSDEHFTNTGRWNLLLGKDEAIQTAKLLKLIYPHPRAASIACRFL